MLRDVQLLRCGLLMAGVLATSASLPLWSNETAPSSSAAADLGDDADDEAMTNEDASEAPPARPGAAKGKKAAKKAAAAAKGGKKGANAVEPDDEARALAFAREHHPALADLLEPLKTSSPKEYGRALADLVKAEERLRRLERRMPQQYSLELKEWKLTSQLRLLAARRAIGDQSSLEDEMRGLLRERQTVKQELLQIEQDRLTKRLSKVDGDLKDLAERPEEVVERDLKTLMNGADQVKRQRQSKRQAQVKSSSTSTSASSSASASATASPSEASASAAAPAGTPTSEATNP